MVSGNPFSLAELINKAIAGFSTIQALKTALKVKNFQNLLPARHQKILYITLKFSALNSAKIRLELKSRK